MDYSRYHTDLTIVACEEPSAHDHTLVMMQGMLSMHALQAMTS